MKFTSHFIFRSAFLLALALFAVPMLLAASADPSSLCLLGMAAATAAIDTPERLGTSLVYPVAADTRLWAGTIGAVDSAGRAVPGSNTAGLRVMGRVEADADNADGLADAITANIKRGVFGFSNSATAALDPDDIGKKCFVEDNQTVAETTTNKVCAGRVMALSEDGTIVWVDTRDAHDVPSADTITGAADLAALKTAMVAVLGAQNIIR